LSLSEYLETISTGFHVFGKLIGGRKELIKAVFFDLGDTLVAEESVGDKSLWEATLEKLPYLDEVLTESKRRGYKLGVITNTVTSREEHVRLTLRKINVEKYFDVIVTSVDVGFNKPDERIFKIALKALDVKPEESVMVGNRISADIIGGNRIGMKTILYKWNERYLDIIQSLEEEPNRTIISLKELPKVLDEI
jgi:HAD superfamily hydrolase (TIGR01662 family)